MATQRAVQSFFKKRLTAEAAEKMNQAGDLWNELPMQFFFPQGEDQVDAVVGLVVSDCEKADKITIRDDIKQEVRTLVNGNTAVTSAIKIVWIATAQPVEENA
jgi:hypothetical protein